MPSTVDRKAQAEQAAQQKRDDRTREQVVRALMNQPDGRRYYWLMLSDLNVFSSTMEFGPNILAATAWKEGKRAHGLFIMEDLMRWTPESFVQMLRENAKQPMETNDVNDD